MNRPNSAPFEAAVTGLGIICAAGIGAKAAWQSAVQGTVGHITRPPTLEGLPHDFAYSVPDFDADTVLGRPLARQMDRFPHLAVAATREALADAALEPSEWDATRVAVLIGSSHGGLTIYDTVHGQFIGAREVCLWNRAFLAGRSASVAGVRHVHAVLRPQTT
ncbi:beta-ketoacyl synthase N-terminal-like domain-containing protein [Streptomyces cyaneus]|uniref:beta-ketoacyl synthase N-terminal-like domain-containing protein n=1 Tax=Streptomyces cyaneus TaxID=1904 RepID=UPI000FF87C19|nr:beta-ketoacyl synthase N-terminal-like domain-containing protein [Streptomyces cyaneus]